MSRLAKNAILLLNELINYYINFTGNKLGQADRQKHVEQLKLIFFKINLGCPFYIYQDLDCKND